MSSSIPTLEVHPPHQEEDGERGRGEGEGEEKAEEVRAEERSAPPVSELPAVAQLKGEQQHQREEEEVKKEEDTVECEQEEEVKREEDTGRVEQDEEANEEEQEEEEEEEETDNAVEGESGGGDGSKKSLKVQSVFALVRSRVRSQGSADGLRKRGIMGVVQQATRELTRAKGDQPASQPREGASCGAEQQCDRPPEVLEGGAEGEGASGRDEGGLETGETEDDDSGGVRGEGGGQGEGGGEGGGVEEVLQSVEALRRELKKETAQLRMDMQLALAGLEVRLTHTLRAHHHPHPHANTNANANSHANHSTSPSVARQPAPPEACSLCGAVERRARPPVVVGGTTAPSPAGTGARRRTLYRTLTALATPTCPPPSLAPRSRSEPLGGRAALIRRRSNGGDTAGRLPPTPPPPPPPGSFPATHPSSQHGRKPLRSKTRLAKLAS